MNIWVPPQQAGAERGSLRGKGSCGNGGASLGGDKGLAGGHEATLSRSGDSHRRGLGRDTCAPLPPRWSRGGRGEQERSPGVSWDTAAPTCPVAS